jgi:hypothetical protein
MSAPDANRTNKQTDVRGKYARDYGRNENLRILAPDLLEVFPDSESVNEALRNIVRITSAAVQPKKKKA